MNNDNFISTKLILVAGLVAFILQAMLAPNIRIGGVGPDFMVLAVVLLAMRSDPIQASVTGFVLGFVCDLLGAGPVGVMALTCTIAAYVIAMVVRGMDLDNFVFPLMLIAISVVAIELTYGIFCIIAGTYAGFFKSLVYRILPAAVYDFVCGALLYLLVGLLSKSSRLSIGKGGKGGKGGAGSAGSMPSAAANFARRNKPSSSGGGMPTLGGGKSLGGFGSDKKPKMDKHGKFR